MYAIKAFCSLITAIPSDPTAPHTTTTTSTTPAASTAVDSGVEAREAWLSALNVVLYALHCAPHATSLESIQLFFDIAAFSRSVNSSKVLYTLCKAISKKNVHIGNSHSLTHSLAYSLSHAHSHSFSRSLLSLTLFLLFSLNLAPIAEKPRTYNLSTSCRTLTGRHRRPISEQLPRGPFHCRLAGRYLRRQLFRELYKALTGCGSATCFNAAF